MKEEIKHVAEVVTSHPKASVAITAAFTSNVWLDYGLPAVQGVTSVLGMFVVFLLAIKHFLDIKKEFSKKGDE